MHKRRNLRCYFSCCVWLILATPAFGQRYLNSSTDSVEVTGDVGITGAVGVTGDVGITGDVEVVGNVAHDAADSGNPIKAGGKAIDYDPDSSGPQGASEVAANDRVNGAYNLRGEMIEGVNKVYWLLTEIDQAYDDDPTSAQSDDYQVWNYRTCRFSFCLDSTLTPTTFQIQIQGTTDGTTDYVYSEDYLSAWMYEDTEVAAEKCYSLPFDVHHRYINVVVTAVGTDDSKFFTLDDSELACSN